MEKKIYPEWSLIGFADDELTARQIQKIIVDFGVKTVVETGIFEGKSTNRFRLTGVNVIGVEISPEYAENSKKLIEREGGKVQIVNKFWEADEKLLLNKSVVKIIIGNSPDVLAKIAPIVQKAPVCLYFLDAHWGDYWPINDEIKALQSYNNLIIVADDIKVPGKDWGYISYKDKDLDWDLIKDDVCGFKKNFRYFYTREVSEKSARHGKIYIFVGDIAGKVRDFDGEGGFTG
jgi:predicted O-methyltransferase YrrM